MRSEFLLFPLLVLVVAGCQAPTAHPLAAAHAGSDPKAQMDFWHSLPDRKAVSNDEAFHALLLFADGKDPATSYADRLRILRERKMLPDGFDAAADAPLRRGTLAVGLLRALSIKGGLTLHLFSGSPRYSVRELEYAGLYPPSSPHQTFSGAELIGIIGRAEDYQRGQAAIVNNPSAEGSMQGITDRPELQSRPTP